MSFLQPLLLYGLPLALLPVLIHLIHLYRRRTIRWAAMMFLLAAQKMNKGFSRLRRWLILASRVLAVLALILAVSRPLAGGWLGLTGGAPDTILILLDRSASMEQQNPATGESKRLAGLRNLTKAIKDTVGNRSHLVLVDSAELKPVRLENIFGRDEYHRGMQMDQYKLRCHFKKGTNTILVKCCQNEQTETWTVEWQFQLRVCDAAGTAVREAAKM